MAYDARVATRGVDGMQQQEQGSADSSPDGRPPARVLVFPCGSEIGLEIHRALSHSTHATPIGASSVASHHGRMVFREYWEGLPHISDECIFPALRQLVEQEGIDSIFPAHDDVVLGLGGRDEECGCRVLTPPRETCLVCRSKRLTYDRFREKLPVPAVYDIVSEEYPLPVFLKPEWGQGSKGVMLAHSHAQVHAALERDTTLVGMEYLPGEEYTVDCFTDARGALRFVGARERLRTMNGISVHTRPVKMAEAEQYARIINDEMEMRGAWFFQVKRDHEEVPTLMEIAPRVSGGMGTWRPLGVNLPLLTLFDAMGYPVEIMPQSFDVEMDRALVNRYTLGIEYSHLYIDFDDTFICHGEVHGMAVMLLAQCRARGVRTHLVSRHAGDLEQRLGELGLRGLFDTVQHLRSGGSKAGCIAERDAIFIDDSFAERRAVQEACGIPVFGVDAIEALLDWRA